MESSICGINNHEESSIHGMNFPTKLYKLLSIVDELNIGHIVSWQPHGHSFRVHDVDAFVTLNNPSWFVYTKYSSFQRQLNIYGFLRITNGTDKNCYFHKHFLRGQPHLMLKIVRIPLKKAYSLKSPSIHDGQPDHERLSCTIDGNHPPSIQEVPNYTIRIHDTSIPDAWREVTPTNYALDLTLQQLSDSRFVPKVRASGVNRNGASLSSMIPAQHNFIGKNNILVPSSAFLLPSPHMNNVPSSFALPELSLFLLSQSIANEISLMLTPQQLSIGQGLLEGSTAINSYDRLPKTSDITTALLRFMKRP